MNQITNEDWCSLSGVVETYDIVKNIYEKANKLDKTIIDMILDGKEITAVAEEVGISMRQIYRRLQKYRSVK